MHVLHPQPQIIGRGPVKRRWPVRQTVLSLTALVLVALIGGNSQAIDLDFTLNPGTDEPEYDPTGAGLMSMFDYAESFYQHVFEDTDFSVDISVGYAPLGDLLGQYNGFALTINLDTSTSWFIDPTPGDDSEFDMEQVLWRDITDVEKADWYSNYGPPDNIPDTFEVGYLGSGPADTFDMLTTVLHEVGHALGISQLTVAETLDGDYDFDPSWVFGRPLAVETANISGDDGLQINHLENPNSMMAPVGSFEQRTLPSHTDLMAMASALQLDDLDLPRREFYGNSNWQNDGNWTGNAEPGSGDEVFVRAAQPTGSPPTASLTGNGFAAMLHVAEGANVDTNNHKLEVSGDVDVSDPDSDIFINPGGELEAVKVTLLNQAEIEMSGGTLDVERLQIGNAQLESTDNTVSIEVAELLVNAGDIVANGNSRMNFDSAAAAPWDLDGAGTEQGKIDATDGDIYFLQGATADNFHGQLLIGGGHTFSFAEPWALSSFTSLDGSLQFISSGTLAGGEVTVWGPFDVMSGTAQVTAPMVITSGGDVVVESFSELVLDNTFSYSAGNLHLKSGSSMMLNDVATIDSTSSTTIDGAMIFNHKVTIENGTFQGSGKMAFNAIALIEGTAELGVDTLELGDFADLTIRGEDVSVDVDQVSIAEQAELEMNGSEATANNFEKGATGIFALLDSRFTLRGGTGNMNSSFAFGGSSANDPSTFRIEQGANMAVTHSWQIAEAPGEWATTIVTGAANGNPSRLRGTSGGADADLIVGGAGNGTLLVNFGGFVGLKDDLIIGRDIKSHGQVTVIGVNREFRSTIDVTGGSNADIQIGGGEGGTGGTGILRIENGALVETSSNVTLAQFPDAEGHLVIAGNVQGHDAELIVDGGVYVGGTASSSGGEAVVHLSEGGRLSAKEMIVWADGVVDLTGGDLYLDVLDLHSGGGTFNLTGGALHAEAVLGDLVNQSGIIAPGGSPGSTTVRGNLTQKSDAVIQIELGGTKSGDEFDRLEVSDVATLDGLLDVQLLDLGSGPYTPAAGDLFEIIYASEGFEGRFEKVLLPELSGDLKWQVTVDSNSYSLEVLSTLLAGDFDADGDVDGRDFMMWQRGDSPDPLSAADLADWRANYGSSTAQSSALSAVPEPAAWLMLTLAAAMTCGRGRGCHFSGYPGFCTN